MEKIGQNLDKENGQRRRPGSQRAVKRDASPKIKENGQGLEQHGTGLLLVVGSA